MGSQPGESGASKFSGILEDGEVSGVWFERAP